MKNTHNRFDLANLLKIPCLDMQMAVMHNPAIQVDEYHQLLSKLVNQSPDMIDILDRIASLESEKIQNLAEGKNILREIGCNTFLPVIDDIVKLNKVGPNAKKLSQDIHDLCAHIKNAEKAPESGTMPAAVAGDISLSKALALLEQKEANRKMRILAVDDSPVMLQTISSVLSDYYTVYLMVNPAMLEKFLKQVTPELFLLDYKMPEISGFDLVPVIRNFEEHKDTPILFLTSEGRSDHISSALMLGARDYIIKPFQPDMLREKIAKYIVRKNLLEKKVA
jgi:CheY-like chemotaxis protein